MTDREKALAYFRHREAQIPMPGARAMYQEAIKALEAQEAKAQLSAEGTTSDLISRQQAIDALEDA